jgi:hypothetical protein
MWKIIKYEILYSQKYLMIGALLLLSLIINAVLDINFPGDENSFIGRYFWGIVIAFGIYILLYSIWAGRVKTKRDRLHHLLPLSISEISFARWFFAVLPLIAALIFFVIFKFLVHAYWLIQIDRIIGQLGFFITFLAFLLAARDLSFITIQKSEFVRLFASVLLMILMALGMAVIIAITSTLIFDKPIIYEGALLFFGWGIILSSLSIILYRKRKTYFE